MIRPARRGVAAALLLVLATAGTAIAHPSFNPNQLPSGEAVDAVLVVPHGCDPSEGMPEEGQASPTVVFDLQLSGEVTSFEAHPVEGWTVERVSDGEVVRWAATDGGTTEPIEFPVTLTVDGPVDEPFYLAAFQECEQGSFRWVGTPDQEAEYPAVKLTTTAGEIGTSEPEEGGHAGTGDDDHADDGHADDGHADGAHTEEDGAEGDDAGAEPADEDRAADGSAEAAAESGVSWVVLAVLAAVLLGAAAVIWSRR